MASVYRIANGVSLRKLDGVYAAYVGQRFETHLLDDAGGQILDALLAIPGSERGCGASALVDTMLVDEADSQSPDVQLTALSALMPLLTELVRVGVLTIDEC